MESFVEQHLLGLFTPTQYMAAFTAAGLTVEHDPIGLADRRGLYIGTAPSR